jgi:hypothetical protein
MPRWVLHDAVDCLADMLWAQPTHKPDTTKPLRLYTHAMGTCYVKRDMLFICFTCLHVP